MFLNILESRRHKLCIAHGLTLMTPDLMDRRRSQRPGPSSTLGLLGPLTNGATSHGFNSGVPFGPMVFRALLIERCTINTSNFFFYLKDWNDIFVKLGHVQCCMSPIVTQYAMSFLKTMLINNPSPKYKRKFFQPYNNHPWVWRSSICFYNLLSVLLDCGALTLRT